MIAIKGMEMPKRCIWDCPLAREDGGACQLADIRTSDNERPKDCPLVEIKPIVHAHWDVIDQDSEGDECFVHTWETLCCSRCGMERTTEDGYIPQYCESCGAKMDE